MKKLNFPYLVRIFLVLACALIFRALILQEFGFKLFDSDQAIPALTGKHILEGRGMIYYYGQNFMGSLEAYVAALFYIFHGVNILSAQLAPLTFYLLFLVFFYPLVTRWFDGKVATLACLWLALSPPLMTKLSLASLGGYPETLFFATLFLWFLPDIKSGQGVRHWKFGAGLALGIGLWVNSLILILMAPITVYYLLRSALWSEIHASLNFKQWFCFGNLNRSKMWSVTAALTHSIFIIVWLLNFSKTLFPSALSFLQIIPSSPAIDPVCQIALLLAIELTVICFTHIPNLIKKLQIRCFSEGILGFTLGYAPELISIFLSGPSSPFHSSNPTSLSHTATGHVSRVISHYLSHDVLGFHIQNFSLFQHQQLFLVLLTITTVSTLVLFFVLERHHFKGLLKLRPAPYSASALVLILFIIPLLIFSVSKLEAERYLMPLYLSLSIMIAYGMAQIQKNSKRRVLFYSSSYFFFNPLETTAPSRMHQVPILTKLLADLF